MFTKKTAQENQNHKGSCCKNGSCSSGTAVKDQISMEKTQDGKTRITVKYDIGFNNTLFIRGTFGNLTWNKGMPMKNVRSDEWVWETDRPFQNGEFKVLINDTVYEGGQNHQITAGNGIKYTPYF